MRNYGFIGGMGVGKTTLANQLVSHGYTKYSLASEIYDIARTSFDMTTKDRALLQNIGRTGRTQNPNIWVDKLVKQINGSVPFVIDDIRYQNEIDQLRKSFDITIVRIVVSPDIQELRLRAAYPDTYQDHIARISDESETQKLICDRTVTSDDASLDHMISMTDILYDMLVRKASAPGFRSADFWHKINPHLVGFDHIRVPLKTGTSDDEDLCAILQKCGDTICIRGLMLLALYTGRLDLATTDGPRRRIAYVDDCAPFDVALGVTTLVALRRLMS